MPRLVSRLAVVVLLAWAAAAEAQVPVTFRFLPNLTPPAPTVVRAFVPGSFNDWGPNVGGNIAPGAASQMTLDAATGEYRYTRTLTVGTDYAYKVHYHTTNTAPSYGGTWIADPLNPRVVGTDANSAVLVTDPMLFQLAREQNASGQIAAVSASVFGTQAVQSVTFTVNGTVYTSGITDTGNGVYRLVLPAPVPVGSLFRVDATDALGRSVTASVGALPPTVTDAPVPAGLPDGITYDPADPSRATLVLRAPGKQYVYVRGPFNNWQASATHLLSRDTSDPRGTRWWITLTGLAPDTDTPFQYLVDGQIEVADPYSARVLYPGQVGFPTGRSTFPVGILHPGAPAFPWTDAGFEAPAPEDLVIYELNLRDFLADRSFATLADTLGYLTRLGVNTVELMPVSQRDDADSWGYDPGFHFAVENRYGRPEDLKAFVDAAHAAGLAVLLDVVYNHATSQSPLVRLDNVGETGPPNATNPWANPTAPHDFAFFNDLNHTSPLTQLWLDAANRWWIEEYHVDGYRFDFTSGFMQTGPFTSYNQNRVDILTRMIGALRTVHPNTLITMEHLTPVDEVRAVTTFGQDRGWPGSLSWVMQSEGYRTATSGFPTASSASFQASYTPTIPNGGLPVRNGIVYMESHDEQWMMYQNLTAGNASGGYSVRDFNTALDRQKLAASFFFTVPGARLMWQFEELGYGGGPGECLVNTGVTCPAGTAGRINAKPIRWDYYAPGVQPVRGSYTGGAITPATDAERASRLRLFKTFQALIGLREDYAIFRDPATQVQPVLDARTVRLLTLALPNAPAGEPRRAFVFGNFGVAPAQINVLSPEAVTWYDFFGDTAQSFPAGTQTLTLAPGEFHIWTDTDVPSPEPGLVTVADEDGTPETGTLALEAFPNPTASRAAVRYALAEASDVTLAVYDVLGRRVAVLAEGAQAAGSHTADLNADVLPPGLYLVRLVAGDQTRVVPLTVAR
ncbi:MAG TPA: alpha-amylase family glycosyl hydrolase [Rubricoccaceae bacterium]|jgi:1,4-alpha-glucan branching enzyme